MKKILLYLISISIIGVASVHAQAPIPNGDFEQWSNGKPVGWTVDDTTVVGQSFTPITQTSDAHSGTSAIKESVDGVTVGGQTFAQIPPIAISGTVSSKDTGGFAYTDRPNSITGFYKFSPVGGDSASIIVAFKKNGAGIGGGGGRILTPEASYTSFAFPIYWNTTDAPDTAIITIAILGSYTNISNVGANMEVDDLAFSNQIVGGDAVNSSDRSSFSLDQNYPNPLVTASSTKLTYALNAAGYATLSVYNVDGNLVAQPVSEYESAGPHLTALDCTTLPAGMYVYRLTCGDRSLSRSFQVVK